MKKIAILGPKKTFSDLAIQYSQIAANAKPLYESSIKACFERLKEEADYALVPVENTLEGYVQPTLDGLIKYDYHIIEELYLNVQFSCVGLIANLSELKTLYVQFAARGQCQQFIEKLQNVEVIITESNMDAFNRLSKKGEAAIVPFHLYDEFTGFKIENVTDSNENETRFILLSKKASNVTAQKIKVFIVITPLFDRPGLLYEILKVFSSYQINLISIMSRPTKEKMGHYYFFIEMFGSSYDQQNIDAALDEVKKTFSMKLLGIFESKT
jgi:prephenate dehydratase